MSSLGQKEHCYTETAVTSELHEHAGMEHRHSRRRRSMAVRTPRMEREQCTKHAETNEHEREEHLLEVNRDVVHPSNFKHVHRRGTTAEVNAEDAKDEQRRTAHEHQGQLHGRIFLMAAAPNAD